MVPQDWIDPSDLSGNDVELLDDENANESSEMLRREDSLHRTYNTPEFGESSSDGVAEQGQAYKSNLVSGENHVN